MSVNILHVYGIETELSNILYYEKIYEISSINKYLSRYGVGYDITDNVIQQFDYEFADNFMVKVIEADTSEIFETDKTCHPVTVFIGFILDELYLDEVYNTGMPPYADPCGLYPISDFDRVSNRLQLSLILNVISGKTYNLPDNHHIMIEFINPDIGSLSSDDESDDKSDDESDDK